MINWLNKKIDDWVRNSGKKWIAFILLTIALVLILATFLDTIAFKANTPLIVSVEDFYDDLKSGRIDTIYYNAQEETMRYTLLNDETAQMTMTQRLNYDYPKENWRQTIYPGKGEEDFRREVTEKYNVNVVVASFKPALTGLWNVIASFVMILIMFSVVMMIMMKHMTPEKKFNAVPDKIDTKFADVIGQDEVLKDLRFIVDMLKNDKLKDDKFNARIPKGILLSGPPGTGKTLIARAVAGEAGVPFFSANASEFIDLYVGMGARAVRSLFKQARKNKPCIIFIDEIDAVASKRGATGSTSEDSKTVNALLQEMDGFDKTNGVFIIAATNNPDALDEAIVRAGRFDRQITVGPPRDWMTRKKLFEKYITGADCEADLENIARQTVGFTGADIDAVTNEAKLIAMMSGRDKLTDDNFEQAIDKKVFKANRDENTNKDKRSRDIKISAYHEAGHAVMTYLSKQPIARASIIGSVSGVGGAVFQADKTENNKLSTREEYKYQIMIAYAGRESERIKFGDISDGASSDISQATNLLYLYTCRLGMPDESACLDYDIIKQTNPLSVPIELMSCVSKELINKTAELLRANYESVELVAQALLERETLTGDEIVKIIEKR